MQVPKKLSKGQQEYVESLVDKDKYMLSEGEITKIESMNFYETAHSDAQRYYGDLLAELKYGGK